MKTKILNYFLVSLFILSIFPSCTDVTDELPPVDHFLVSKVQVGEYLPEYIKSVIESYGSNIPEFAPIIEKIEHGVTVYKISYKTDFNNTDVIASGLVCVPMTAGSYPNISYQNGTNTQHSQAPTVNPGSPLFLLLEFMASTGFVITIPDYLGFGESDDMFHPYLDKISTVQTVLDMQRATKELLNNHLQSEMSDDLYLAGYSQGGWATMQVQKAIEEDFSSRFNLKASACGAGPYDLNYINDYVLGQEEYTMPYFLGYIFNSYYNLGIVSTPIEDVFKEPFDAKIPILYDGTKSGEAINDELTDSIPKLFTADYIANYNTDENFSSIKTSLKSNSISAWKTTTPTMLFHGTEDTFVPPMVTSRIYQEFMNEGVGPNDVVLVPLQGATHQSGILPMGIAAIGWFLEIKDAGAM